MRLAVVGTGFAEQHLAWIAAVPGLHVETLCYHSNAARAVDLAGRFGIPAISDDALAVIGAGGIDGLVIVSRPDSHERLAAAALGKGLVLLCDKPLAASLDAATRMRDMTAAAGTPGYVMFQWRTHPAVRSAVRRIGDGAIGDIVQLSLDFSHDFLAGGTTNWPWRHVHAEGGAGALADMGVHLFDLLRVLAPGDWAVTRASGRTVWPRRDFGGQEIVCETEDVADVLLADSASGCLARVGVSRVAVGVRRIRLSVAGTQGTIEILFDPGTADATMTLYSGGAAPQHSAFAGSQLNPYLGFDPAQAGPDAAATRLASFDDGWHAQHLLDQAVRHMAMA